MCWRTTPFRALLSEALLLRFQPNLLNILPLYIILLLIFALALPLLRWPMLLFLVSGALFTSWRALTGLQPCLRGDDSGGWFLNPLAWQFLFMIGAILAYAPPRMPRVRWPLDTMSRAAILVAGVVIILGDRQPSAHPRLRCRAPVIRSSSITQDKTGTASIPPGVNPVAHLGGGADHPT